MEIIKQHQAIATEKSDGTSVLYYVFPEYDIHFNRVSPNTIQQWHHHKLIEETIFIISGEIEIRWIIDSKEYMQIAYPGDIVRVENSPHTLINSSEAEVTFLVLRLVLNGKELREILKSDKYLDYPEK